MASVTTSSLQAHPFLRRYPSLPYTLPFAAFVGLMALEKHTNAPMISFYPLRFVVVLSVLLLLSRHVISFKFSRPALGITLGIVVFLIWVGPDAFWGYRHHWLFENAVTGAAVSSLPQGQRGSWGFILIRVLGSTLLVPVLEELFWRGWMMRWLINVDFRKVPLGAYTPASFWLVAVLFASEHGPYWEVGLITGVLYNWWLIRTRNLADCILAHAVTNGCLAGYVLFTNQWQYWL